MKFSQPKIFTLLIGCILFLSQGIKAQDSLQTSVPYRINWLIKLAEIKEAEIVADSILARGYKPVGVKDDDNTLGGFMALFKIAGNRNYFGLMSEDGDEVTACAYFFGDEEVYKQTWASISNLGFIPTDVYEAGPQEVAFAKDNILLILTTTKSQGKNSFILTATRLVI